MVTVVVVVLEAAAATLEAVGEVGALLLVEVVVISEGEAGVEAEETVEDLTGVEGAVATTGVEEGEEIADEGAVDLVDHESKEGKFSMSCVACMLTQEQSVRCRPACNPGCAYNRQVPGQTGRADEEAHGSTFGLASPPRFWHDWNDHQAAHQFLPNYRSQEDFL